MSYQNEFYSTYVSNHTSELYGTTSRFEIEQQFPIFKAYFDTLLPKNNLAMILDIGCGNGGFVYWLQKKKGYKNAIGIDISEEQVALAERLGFTNISQSDIIEFLSTHQNMFDVIIARDVMEHFTKDENIFLVKRIFQSLQLGGIFIFQTVNAENPLWGRLRHGDFTHRIAFTAQSIKQLFRVAGKATRIEIYPQRPVVHGFKSFIRYLVWFCIEFMLKIYLAIETGSTEGFFTQNIIGRAFKDEII